MQKAVNYPKAIEKALAMRKMSVTDLSVNMRVPYQQVHQLKKNGQPSSKTLEQLAAAFDMKVSELVALGE